MSEAETDVHPIDREARLLDDLVRLSAERAEAEARIAGAFRKDDAEADRSADAGREALAKRRAAAEAGLRKEHEAARAAALSAFESGRAEAEATAAAANKAAARAQRNARDAAEKAREEARWQANAVADAAATGARKRLDEFEAAFREESEVLDGLLNESHRLLDRFRPWIADGPADAPPPDPAPGRSLDALHQARAA